MPQAVPAPAFLCWRVLPAGMAGAPPLRVPQPTRSVSMATNSAAFTSQACPPRVRAFVPLSELTFHFPAVDSPSVLASCVIARRISFLWGALLTW